VNVDGEDAAILHRRDIAGSTRGGDVWQLDACHSHVRFKFAIENLSNDLLLGRQGYPLSRRSFLCERSVPFVCYRTASDCCRSLGRKDNLLQRLLGTRENTVLVGSRLLHQKRHNSELLPRAFIGLLDEASYVA